MKSTDFITESDDKSPEDVKNNHPEIYEFFRKIGAWMTFDRSAKVETYNTASSHMVVITMGPTAGLGNTAAQLENEGIKYEQVEFASGTTLSGSFNGIQWNVKDDGKRGNITETWRFALPHADDEVATPRDRTMEDGAANQNWFDTLAAALESEGLTDTWDSMTMGGISYGETRRWTYDDGTRQGHFISITRDDTGRYERPVHYARGNAIRK